MKDCIIIGCGFAGSVLARELAEKGNKVLILEQRSHIGGNCYDEMDEHGILVHKYGPHIFHTNLEHVYEYLSRFTKWYDYSHEVVGNVYGELLPVPFNLNTLKIVYGEEKAARLEKKLIDTYGVDKKVPILELRSNQDPEIQEIAEYVYENIFLKYTMKQWGQKPEDIDPSVSGRVPVVLSYDNRYFQDAYQGMPEEGYTKLFERLLEHKNIEVKLNTKAETKVLIREDKIYYEGNLFMGQVIFTGAIDEFFNCQFGRLPYRSLIFKMEHYERGPYQTHGVVNYTVSEEFTRITEYPYLTGQKVEDTTIMKEYPIPYSGKVGEIPYYAIINPENLAQYKKYRALVEAIPNFHLLGRLAEYKYYNIDAIVKRALDLSKKILGE
ncbi:MAG: UDP-galactopyranose mutase [Clostridiales bacterium]|nr:UDP-galactopyranose mutase [Clostridiales bacterium]